MTAKHRVEPPGTTTDARPDTVTGNEFRGAAPHGMWWVAWRQHRFTVVMSLSALVLVALALMAFRLVLAARLQAVGCTLRGPDGGRCTYDVADAVLAQGPETWWRTLQAVMWIGPTVLGAFVGAPIFAGEVEQRTEVFALTQSVTRLRWWATKIVVAGVPLIAGLVGLGFFMGWVGRGTWFTAGGAMYEGNFQTRAIMPAAFGLVALAVGITAGILIRSVVPGLVAGLLVAGAIVYLVGSVLRPHLITPSRSVTPLASADGSSTGVVLMPGGDAWYLGAGTADAHGNPIDFDMNKCPALTALMSSPNSGGPDFETKWNTAYQACETQQGIVATYTDYLPAGKLWPLRLIVTGICAAVAALFLAVGFLRLRVLPKSRT